MFQKFRYKLAQLPPFLRNKYLIALTAFAIWMIFADEHNLYEQWQSAREISRLHEKKEFYEQQIRLAEKKYQELTTNPETQEKFAREHYRMKRDNEDVYVIVKK